MSTYSYHFLSFRIRFCVLFFPALEHIGTWHRFLWTALSFQSVQLSWICVRNVLSVLRSWVVSKFTRWYSCSLKIAAPCDIQILFLSVDLLRTHLPSLSGGSWYHCGLVIFRISTCQLWDDWHPCSLIRGTNIQEVLQTLFKRLFEY